MGDPVERTRSCSITDAPRNADRHPGAAVVERFARELTREAGTSDEIPRYGRVHGHGISSGDLEVLRGMSRREVKEAIADALCGRSREFRDEVYNRLDRAVRYAVRDEVRNVTGDAIASVARLLEGASHGHLAALLSRVAETPSVQDRQSMLETLGVEHADRVAVQLYACRTELANGRIPQELRTAADQIGRNAPAIARDLRSAERVARRVDEGNPFASEEITQQIVRHHCGAGPDSFVARSAIEAIHNAGRREIVEDALKDGVDIASIFLPGGIISSVYQAGLDVAHAQGNAEMARSRHLAGTASRTDIRDAEHGVTDAALEGAANIGAGAATGAGVGDAASDAAQFLADVAGNAAALYAEAIRQGRRVIRP